MKQITKNEIYKHYIALDWSQAIVAVASMGASSLKVNLKLISADIPTVKQYLKTLSGQKDIDSGRNNNKPLAVCRITR